MEVAVAPRFKTETPEQFQNRLEDSVARSFKVQVSLGKTSLNVHRAKAQLSAEDGNSYLRLEGKMSHAALHFAAGKIIAEANNDGEISLLSSMITADSPNQAMAIFNDIVVDFLNRTSFLNRAPIFINQISAFDSTNDVMTTAFVSPPRSVLMDRLGETLSVEMKPIYALYREALNSNSPYYKLLCLYKILEGLLGTLAFSVRKKARKLGIQLEAKKILVPNHPNFPNDLEEHIGKPIKEFFDGFLQKQHRNAVSHFILKSGKVLDVAVFEERKHFTNVSFVTDLCAREMIQSHEEHLRSIYNAEFGIK